MEQNDFKRKIYNELIKWNNDQDKVPLIIDGLRQVGKSYIVNKFAHEFYANVITYDFRHKKELRNIFEGNLDVDTIIEKSSPYFPHDNFVPYKTILIFEEIGDCPLARTSLKSFAIDKRFSVIATGSLLGVLNFRRKKKIDIPTDILLKLSDYYNTSIDYILCRTNNKNPYKKSEKYDKIMSR